MAARRTARLAFFLPHDEVGECSDGHSLVAVESSPPKRPAHAFQDPATANQRHRQVLQGLPERRRERE